MIFTTPTASHSLARQLDELDELRKHLGDRAGIAGPWLGNLRRQWRAASASSSIAIEGFHVSPAEAMAMDVSDASSDREDEDRMALSCYARAMDHVGVMSGDSSFRWNERVVLDLHFDACYFQTDGDPGQYRRGPIEVTSPGGGPPAYVGPPHVAVPALMAEMIAWLDHGDLDAHVVVRAAMAHLHLVSIHPFRDGNGRIARIVQSLVLARGGLLAPEFLSIEEYLGRNTDGYYAALGQVQRGSYEPSRDATSWVRFCVRAHIEQAQRRLAQLAQAATRWSYLESLVEQRQWPDRMVVALEQSLFGGVDRASYATEAEVSAATATNDLRRLLDAQLVVRRGRGRTTRYSASDMLRSDLQRHLDGQGRSDDGAD
jgi:Fic/DOC family